MPKLSSVMALMCKTLKPQQPIRLKMIPLSSILQAFLLPNIGLETWAFLPLTQWYLLK